MPCPWTCHALRTRHSILKLTALIMNIQHRSVDFCGNLLTQCRGMLDAFMVEAFPRSLGRKSGILIFWFSTYSGQGKGKSWTLISLWMFYILCWIFRDLRLRGMYDYKCPLGTPAEISWLTSQTYNFLQKNRWYLLPDLTTVQSKQLGRT